MYSYLKNRIRHKLGLKTKREKEDEQKERESYIKMGWTDSKYQFYLGFSYNDKDHILRIERIQLNPLWKQGNTIKGRAMEIQNQQALYNALRWSGWVLDKNDENNSYRDYWNLKLQLREVINKQEAINILNEFLNKYYPNHDELILEETQEKNGYDDSTYPMYWMRTLIELRPLIDTGKKWGKEQSNSNMGWGIFQDGDAGTWIFRFGFLEYHWRYETSLGWVSSNNERLWENTKFEKYIPKLPDYVPAELHNLPYDKFVWEVLLRGRKRKLYKGINHLKEEKWTISGIREPEWTISFENRLGAIEFLHNYMIKYKE